MIISLRGTHGSGKSYLMRQLMARFPTEPESVDERGRTRNYKVMLSNGHPLYIVGNYDKACGGCDGIQPYDLIWGRVEEMIKLGGHVIFEGALVSSGYGRIGVASEPYGDNFVFAFLQTPPKQCEAHVLARREAKGNTKPFNPRNIHQKYHAVQLSIKNIGVNHGRRVVLLDHRKAIAQILGLLYKGEINPYPVVKTRPTPARKPK